MTIVRAFKEQCRQIILGEIKKRSLPIGELEEIFDTPRQRINELLIGKMGSISIKVLLGYINDMGIEIELTTKNGDADERKQYHQKESPRLLG